MYNEIEISMLKIHREPDELDGLPSTVVPILARVTESNQHVYEPKTYL